MSYSAKKRVRSKGRPQRISSVTLGTHVSRDRGSARNTSSRQVPFSHAKKSARARRGMVDQVMPETQSAESVSNHAKRVNRPHYTVAIRRNARAKNLFIAALIIVVVLLVAGGVGAFAYAGSVSDRMALTDQKAKAALVPAAQNEPFYTLFVGEYSEAGREYRGPSLMILARVDQDAHQVTLVSIPTNLQVQLSNGDFGKISEAQLLGGDEALIQEVSDFAGVSISHYAKTSNDGFIGLVDGLGGITVDVTEEVDDPAAGSLYIPAGTQELDGLAALTLSRATNFKTGEERRAENQSNVGIALAKKLLEAESFGFIFTLDGIADKFQSDWSAGDLMTFIGSLRGLSNENIYTARVPGYSTTSATTNTEYFVADETGWESLRSAMDSGQSLSDVNAQSDPVDPASFDIIVRNGSGIAGDAQQVADSLTSAAFQIKEIGNTDQPVYGETLVVYESDEMADAAQTVVTQLGMGRAVASNGFYSFDSDVLIVVGKDWKPLN